MFSIIIFLLGVTLLYLMYVGDSRLDAKIYGAILFILSVLLYMGIITILIFVLGFIFLFFIIFKVIELITHRN